MSATGRPKSATTPKRTGYGAKAFLELEDSPASVDETTGEKKRKIPHIRVDNKTTIEELYEVGRRLGKGAFGTVHAVIEKATGKKFASKVISKQRGHSTLMEQMQREVTILKKVDHPHIVKLKEVYETPSKIYLIMELCEGGELMKAIRKEVLPEDDVRKIIKNLVEVVAYLHDYGVVHRDIKPENILLVNEKDLYNIKLTDFGLATFIDSCNMIENTAGTPFYMAPEVFVDNGYSQQCDIWSIGIILYLLLCGHNKKTEKILSEMVTQTKKIEYPDEYWANVSPSAKNLVDMLLQWNPAHRITAKEILTHPWILNEDPASVPKSQSTLLPSVLLMMRSYNAERRLKRGMLAVWAFVRWQRIGKERSDTLRPESLRGRELAAQVEENRRYLEGKDIHESEITSFGSLNDAHDRPAISETSIKSSWSITENIRKSMTVKASESLASVTSVSERVSTENITISRSKEMLEMNSPNFTALISPLSLTRLEINEMPQTQEEMPAVESLSTMKKSFSSNAKLGSMNFSQRKRHVTYGLNIDTLPQSKAPTAPRARANSTLAFSKKIGIRDAPILPAVPRTATNLITSPTNISYEAKIKAPSRRHSTSEGRSESVVPMVHTALTPASVKSKVKK